MIWNRKPGLIGVDIGTHAVKLAQVERTGDGFALRDAAVILRRTPWHTDEGNLTPAESSADEVRACKLLAGRFIGRRSACVLPMAVCDVRAMQLHAGDARHQQESIKQELRSVWGAGNEFVFDAWNVADAAPSVQKQVNVLSTAQRWSDQVARDHRESRLTCQILDGLPTALARAIRLADDGKNEPLVAALDWGFTRATFCLLENGNPVFVRCIRDGGYQHVINTVCQSLDVSIGEAQLLLRQHGLPESTTDDDEIRQLVEDVTADAIDSVCEELKRTLTFVASQMAGQTPSRLWLFGGGASFNQVDRALTDKVGLPVQVWQPRLLQATDHGDVECPLELFGPAAALSVLAWEAK